MARPDVFRVLGAVADSRDVLRCRLFDDKITHVHRRVWPALAPLARRIGERGLDRQDQEDTETGRHRTVTTRRGIGPTRLAAAFLATDKERRSRNSQNALAGDRRRN
jgi:hypothetical protein